MIRFSNGVPTYVWFSQHSNGEAFAYDVVHKNGLRVLSLTSASPSASQSPLIPTSPSSTVATDPTLITPLPGSTTTQSRMSISPMVSSLTIPTPALSGTQLSRLTTILTTQPLQPSHLMTLAATPQLIGSIIAARGVMSSIRIRINDRRNFWTA